MDVEILKEIITKQLQDKSPLHSLQIQNHIYGCFILMEDLAQGIVSLDGDSVTYQDSTFNINEQFSNIGLKYGFVISDDLALNNYNDEYKAKMIEIFRSCDLLRDVDALDNMEDEIIKLINELLDDKVNLFRNALDTGRLSDDLLESVLDLIESEGKDKTEFLESLEKDKALSPPKKKYHYTRRRVHRKLTPSNIKRLLNKTRRNLK